MFVPDSSNGRAVPSFKYRQAGTRARCAFQGGQCSPPSITLTSQRGRHGSRPASTTGAIRREAITTQDL